MSDYSYTAQFLLPRQPITKIKELYDALVPVHQAVNIIAEQVDRSVGVFPTETQDYPQQGFSGLKTGTMNKFYAICNLNIPVNAVVTFVAFGLNVRVVLAKADSPTTPGRAINVTRPFISGQYGEFIMSDVLVEGFFGLTPGATYYLSPTTAGTMTVTKPTTAGQIVQQLGIALTDTAMFVRPHIHYNEL